MRTSSETVTKKDSNQQKAQSAGATWNLHFLTESLNPLMVCNSAFPFTDSCSGEMMPLKQPAAMNQKLQNRRHTDITVLTHRALERFCSDNHHLEARNRWRAYIQLAYHQQNWEPYNFITWNQNLIPIQDTKMCWKIPRIVRLLKKTLLVYKNFQILLL